MERKDVTVNLGTAKAVAGAGLGGTPPVGDAEAGDGHLDASERGSSVAKYRKKPVVIEAIHYDGNFPVEFLGETDLVQSAGDGTGAIEIVTLEGTMRANVGDWVIRGVRGELYPCKPDIFEATYEPA